jgi:hypothetical protein
MKRLAAGLLLLLATSAVAVEPAPGVAQAQTLLARPLHALEGAQQIRGNFTQLRYLTGMPKPLRSTGTFAFIRELGVLWQTQTPFASQLVLTPQAMRSSQGGGTASQVSAAQQPGLKAAAATLLSLFSLDLQGLSAQFDLAAVPAGKGWLLTLKPKSAALASAVGQMSIQGGEQIEQIEVVDGRGDRTTLQLSGVSISAQPPSAAERAPFTAQ